MNLSAFGDEMSTLWIIRGNDFTGVISTVNSDAEISPPFYFLLAKVSSWVIGQTPTGVRFPSFVAGVLLVPAFYWAGVLMLGRRAALWATAIAALSPFLVYFSANARAYSVMLLCLVLAAIFLWRATSEGSRWWDWAGWAVAGALAVYSHYTAALVVFGQFAWALWCFPALRKKTLAWTVVMALAFAPWLGGLRADLDSPTSIILEELQGQGLSVKLDAVKQFFLLRIDPGARGFFDRPEILLGLAGLLVAAIGIVSRFLAGTLAPPRGERGRGVALAVLMSGAPFAGELLLLALGTDIFGARNLAAAWSGVPLLAGAGLAAAGSVTGVVAGMLILAAFAVNNVSLLDPDKATIPFRQAAEWLEARESQGGVILDDSIISPLPLSPAPLSPLDGYLSSSLPEYRLTNLEDRPDFIERMYATYDAQAVVDEAFADPGPVRLVTVGELPRELPGGGYTFQAQEQKVRIPSGWTISESVDLPGLEDIHIRTFVREEQTDE